MIILDTNVVSEPSRQLPDRAVREWIDTNDPNDLYICTPVLAELRYGVERLDAGRRRERLRRWVDQLETERFHDRILPFDQKAARAFAQIVVERNRSGRPIAPMDALIAAITLANNALLATRDIGGFSGLGFEIVNPFGH
jgi:predicted nucleic acid-binding protein